MQKNISTKKIIKQLSEEDPEIFSLIEKEKERLNSCIELIPSENIASKAVLEAMGSILTNKYSEGYPGKRYYGGNHIIDKIENVAINRAKKLFGAEHVNVQPYSGSPANFSVYSALIGARGKLLGMRLDMGGHLTHGHKASLTGKFFEAHHYGVNRETELIDFDEVKKIAKEIKPNIIVSGASAYPRKIDFKAFNEIAEEIGAISMADISHISGLVVAKHHPSPFPFTDVVTTTTHKTLRGPRAAMILCKEKFAKQIDSAVFPGLQGGPHNNTIAAIAVALKEAETKEFENYADKIIKNAKVLADELINHGFRLVTGGTDNHLILIDLTNKNISGQEAQIALDEAGITVNKNAIPFDARKPNDPSGIRIGTPLITTRGMGSSEMKFIAEKLAKVISNIKDTNVHEQVKREVLELSERFKIE